MTSSSMSAAVPEAWLETWWYMRVAFLWTERCLPWMAMRKPQDIAQPVTMVLTGVPLPFMIERRPKHW